MLTYADTASSSTMVSLPPVPCSASQASVTEPLLAVRSKTAQAKPPTPELLPMLRSETFTAYQRRAALAGQQYYLEHFSGTYASHQDLCAFLKRKLSQWDRHHTTSEWKVYWLSGWQTAQRTDPTTAGDAPWKQEASRQRPAPAPTHQQHAPDEKEAWGISGQVPAPLPVAPTLPGTISALVAQPDFLGGLGDAQQVYWDNQYEGVLTEGEMMELIEENVSRRGRERDCQHCRWMGMQPPSYLYALGLVVGLIGMGFAQQPSV